MEGGHRLRGLLLGVILLLMFQVYITEQSARQGEKIYPDHYAFANSTVVTSGDSHCERYNRDLLPLTALLNTTGYFNCSQPGLLTNSNLGPEQLSPSDTTQVYTWEPGVNRLLLTFAPPPRDITTIVLYYYRNSTGVGLPKAVFCAESADFQIWNMTTGARCVAQDEIRPSGSECVEPCRENVSIEFNHFTEKVLLLIEDSKNYRFIVSEIEFYAIENTITTTTEQLVNVQPTTEYVMTDVDVTMTGNIATNGTTVIDKETTEKELIDSAAVSTKQQITILTLASMMSIAFSMIK